MTREIVVDPQCIVALPMTAVAGFSWKAIPARSEVSVRINYLVIPKLVARDFAVRDISIGNKKVLLYGDGIVHAEIFAGEIDSFGLKDANLTKIELDHPIPLDIGVLAPNQELVLEVLNLNPSARNFLGSFFGTVIR